MRSYSFWSCVAILALAVGVRAEDTYTIKLKHAPDVDKSVKVTDSDTRIMLNKITDPDGKVLGDDKKHTIKTDEVYTETVLEKGDKVPNKYKRIYEKATRTIDDKKPEATSYEGRTLNYEKKDGKYTVTAEGDKPLNDKDLAELTAKANDDNGEQDEVFLPGKAVKVGDTWKVDGKKLVAVFPGGERLDGERSGGDVKLTKVYEKDGHQFGVMAITLKVGLKVPKGAEFEKPPVMEMKLTLDTAIDGKSSAATMTSSMILATKGSAEQGGKKYTIEQSMETSGKKVRSAEK